LRGVQAEIAAHLPIDKEASMSYSSEHRRMAPVLEKARQLDIATNPTPEDHPQGWDGVPLTAGAFAKPCGFVGTATWKWEDERIVAISLDTDAYDLADHRPEVFARQSVGDWISIHNCLEDIAWAERKIGWLLDQAGGPCPPIVVE